jgi:hypothetical protein
MVRAERQAKVQMTSGTQNVEGRTFVGDAL